MRLLKQDVAGEFFRTVVSEACELRLTGDEHLTVEGTLIEAWASLKSLRLKDQTPTDHSPPDDRNPSVNFHGAARTRPISRPPTPKRGWQKRKPAKRPSSATPRACWRRIAMES